jgi:hypothetical protein
MGDIFQSVISMIAKGEAGAITAILLGIIGFLGWYCFRQMKQLEKKDEKIYKIIDDYSKNNITITEAMNGLKMVLIEIKAKL